MSYIDDIRGAIASKERNQAELQAQLEPLRDQLRWLNRNQKAVNARALEILRNHSEQSRDFVDRALAEAAKAAWTEELARRDAAAEKAMQAGGSVAEQAATDVDE